MVATVSRTIAGAVPQLANRHTLLMPLTMSFFGMLNWHYLWFREGKGLTRDQYARMATTLILSGAEAAAAAAGEASAPGTTRRAKLKTAQPG
jgi:hypothetical protein